MGYIVIITQNYAFGIYPTRYIVNLDKLKLRYIVEGRRHLNTKEAVAKRILVLCEERNIAINALANTAGIPPSTIYSMLNEKSRNPGVVSLKKICDGLEISLREFFDSEIFDDLEQEIK